MCVFVVSVELMVIVTTYWLDAENLTLNIML